MLCQDAHEAKCHTSSMEYSSLSLVFATLLLLVNQVSGFVDLFHQLDSRLSHGYYRIPGVVTTANGTVLAFVLGGKCTVCVPFKGAKRR